MVKREKIKALCRMIWLFPLCLSGVLLLCSCGQPADGKPEIKVEIDGVSAAAIPAKGNYVVFAESTDTSVWTAWDYDAWKIAGTTSKDVIYTLHFYSVDRLFPSVEAMAAATDLTPGMKIGTTSFREGSGRGAARYTVSADEEVDFYRGDQKLKGSNAAAVFVPFVKADGKTLATADQYGALGTGSAEGTWGDERYVGRAAKSSYDEITFESDVYVQRESIDVARDNLYFNGRGAEFRNFYVGLGEKVGHDFSFSGKNVTVENLVIVCTEQNGPGTLYNKAPAGHAQCSVGDVEHFTIRNCRILVPEEGDQPRNCNSIWIYGTGSDILVENNYLQNFSDSGDGGGLWFSTEGKMTDIVVRGNHVEKNSCDEAFAFFIGEFENVLVEDNYIYTHDHMKGQTSHHAVGFGVWDIPTSMKNVVFRNNEIRVNCDYDAIIFDEIENFEMYGNKIRLFASDYDHDDVTDDDIRDGVFRYPEPDKYGATNAKIHDNYIEVHAKGAGKIGAFVVSCPEGMEFYGNTFVAYGKVGALTTGDHAVYHDNTFTIHGQLLSEGKSKSTWGDGNVVTVEE